MLNIKIESVDNYCSVGSLKPDDTFIAGNSDLYIILNDNVITDIVKSTIKVYKENTLVYNLSKNYITCLMNDQMVYRSNVKVKANVDSKYF